MALGVVSLVVLAVSGYAWTQYKTLSSSIKTSDVISKAGGPKSVNGDTNILIMGLDTRLDENGNALPQNIYDALHAGNQSDGGNNSNVLMMLHVPGDGSKATAISIPRDDYVTFPGCPDNQCHGKIKQAYGLAFDQESKHLAGGTDRTQREQAERDAGRKAEIATVSQFLGGVAVDHFVEVTLVAFFQIAQVVQPITVCVNENTQDSNSGANFHQGQQQITAAQALAFVRQRRDDVHPALNFTDLDRERRQQAFISSLAFQLKQGGTFSSPSKLSAILTVAKQNIAIDSGLDLLSFAQQASNLTGGNITFFTLPIDHFGKDSFGEDVNFVNLPLIQSTVHQLLSKTPAAGTATPAPASTSSQPKPVAAVDVVNASARNGYATKVEQALTAQGFTHGTASTQRTLSHTSVIDYGSGAASAAAAASSLLGGMSTRSDSAIAAGTVHIVLGTDFTLPTGMGGAAGPTTPPPATAVPATGGGVAGPPPTALSALAGGGITCVK
ncbi:MAG TPA: LCP family protein [Pseudonocardiaceae bacterium]